MYLPKTIKGWILMMREIECHSIVVLKGFDNLPAEDQEMLIILDAEISNHINEVKSYPINPNNHE